VHNVLLLDLSSARDLATLARSRLDSVLQLSQLPQLLGLTPTSPGSIEDNANSFLFRSTRSQNLAADGTQNVRSHLSRSAIPAAIAASGTSATIFRHQQELVKDEHMEHDQESNDHCYSFWLSTTMKNSSSDSRILVHRCKVMLLVAATSAARLGRLSSDCADSIKQWKDLAEGLVMGKTSSSGATSGNDSIESK
jgi:hypothetical protein